MQTSSVPKIVIAGTHSGCGKTTTAVGIMAALRKRGLVVQPFKVGPDFIDPTHHTQVCGRESRNLDPFMMTEENVRKTFVSATKGADIAVIEGVMGLYDGVDGGDESSTAHVARILDAPIILVADVKGMSRSCGALVSGYTGFDKSLRFAGAVLTKGGSERHRSMVCSALPIPVLGWIPRTEALAVESRHLGLLLAEEDSRMKQTAELIEETCLLDEILKAASAAPAVSAAADAEEKEPAFTLAAASDSAFCFSYADNFTALRNAGAEIVFFSPLEDTLPEADAYYFCGGYPELHAKRLESSPCISGLKKAADSGTPIFGECGGLMWLSRTVTDSAGKTYRMAGVLDADSLMQKRFAALGYSIGKTCGSSYLANGTAFRGHEFHYSVCEADRDARFDFLLSRGKGIAGGKDGLVCGNTLAGYTHIYFGKAFADAFAAGVRR